ncbi:unnamed protein product [Clonostachys byssicola]|uniref:NAD(P)-binding domain-containing protein n=1 Tax=Clonostachys byssicola TaxID=160290 RepID=A0A9N9Y6W5_9HYPO|nr:unnamed protein product [Clonostachys byssicola]
MTKILLYSIHFPRFFSFARANCQIPRTGASGYIGGDLLYLIAKRHPEYGVTALVRNDTHIETINQVLNNVQVVQGTLDDEDILEREATEADIVLTSSSHVKSVQSIHRGLLGKLDRGEKLPYWVQMSGGAAVVSKEVANRNWEPGTGSDHIWDDLDGIASIKSIIRNDPTRAVDNYMMSVAQSSSYIKTAVIYPPIIYGSGRGPVNQRSVQVPDLVEASLKRGRAFRLGPGLNRWGNIHIRDLSEMILRLIEKAVQRHTDNNVWGQDGIYLTGVGEVAAAAFNLGLLPDASVEVMKEDQFNRLLSHHADFPGTILYGTNSRGGSNRARKYLDWIPTHHSLEEDIVETVTREGVRLGLIGAESLDYILIGQLVANCLD